MSFQGRNTKAAKLTITEVREMRERYAEGWTQGRLSAEYGIGIIQVGRIVRGECWKDGAPQRKPQEVSRESLEKLAEMSKMIKEGTLKPERVRGRFGVVEDVPEAGRELPPGEYGERGEGERPEDVMRQVMAERSGE